MKVTLPSEDVAESRQAAVQALYSLTMNVAAVTSEGLMPDQGDGSLTKMGAEHVVDTIIHLAKVAANAGACPLCDQMRESVVKRRFEKYAVEWQRATGHLSVTQDAAMHPAYQRIIGLGPVVVPFMIERLRVKPEHWFWALAAIVGEDKAADAKTVPEAAKCWVEWFDQNQDWHDARQITL